MARKKAAEGAAAEAVYTREALAGSKKYAAKRDAIMIALEDGREYTLEEANAALNEFLYRPVVEKRVQRRK